MVGINLPTIGEIIDEFYQVEESLNLKFDKKEEYRIEYLLINIIDKLIKDENPKIMH